MTIRMCHWRTFPPLPLPLLCRVVRHSKTQLSKLYGFVKMAEPSQALSAIEQLNGVHGLEVRLAEQDVGPAHSGELLCLVLEGLLTLRGCKVAAAMPQAGARPVTA